MTCHENNCWEKLKAELVPCSVGVPPPTRGIMWVTHNTGSQVNKCQNNSAVSNTRKTNISVCKKKIFRSRPIVYSSQYKSTQQKY